MLVHVKVVYPKTYAPLTAFKEKVIRGILFSMIRLIIWVIIGLLALSFFGISLQGLVESPTNQGNISFLSDLFQQGFDIIKTWLADVVDFFAELTGN
jgi:hypothetical protein